MNISTNGIEMIKKWEGVRLKAYRDPVGIWTIGYGHTFGVKQGDVCSQWQAEKWLKEEAKSHMKIAEKLITVKITQHMYDALASFHYNLGVNILTNSNLLRLINAKKWKEASEKMKEYNKAGGKVLQGLVNRRNDEAKLFMKNVGVLDKTEKFVFGSRTLKKGMYGADVLVMQEALSKMNFYPEVNEEDRGCDSDFGDKTENALKRWQSVYTPTMVDGIFGKKSKEKLGKQVN